MCMCNFAWKGRPQDDQYCVRRDVKPYSLTVLPFSTDLISQDVFFMPKANWCLVNS